MKLTIEPTAEIIELVPAEAAIRARIWEGFADDDGTPVVLFVVRVAVAADALTPAFDRELEAVERPSTDLWPGRLVIP